MINVRCTMIVFSRIHRSISAISLRLAAILRVGVSASSSARTVLGISALMGTSHQFQHLLPPSWRSQVQTWLAEDTPSFDYGGYVVGEAEREAFLLGKGGQTAVLAGVPFFTEVFEQLGCKYV